MKNLAIRDDIFEDVIIDFINMRYLHKDWRDWLPFKVIDKVVYVLKLDHTRTDTENGKTFFVISSNEEEWVWRIDDMSRSDHNEIIEAYEAYVSAVFEQELLSIDN